MANKIYWTTFYIAYFKAIANRHFVISSKELLERKQNIEMTSGAKHTNILCHSDDRRNLKALFMRIALRYNDIIITIGAHEVALSKGLLIERP